MALKFLIDGLLSLVNVVARWTKIFDEVVWATGFVGPISSRPVVIVFSSKCKMESEVMIFFFFLKVNATELNSSLLRVSSF